MVDAPVGRSVSAPTRMAVSRKGKEARTRYQVEDRFSRPAPTTLMTARLETGRTHQIRVHLSAIGHPVVGDEVYGHGRSLPGAVVSRPFLHASSLALEHPVHRGQDVLDLGTAGRSAPATGPALGVSGPRRPARGARWLRRPRWPGRAVPRRAQRRLGGPLPVTSLAQVPRVAQVVGRRAQGPARGSGGRTEGSGGLVGGFEHLAVGQHLQSLGLGLAHLAHPDPEALGRGLQ